MSIETRTLTEEISEGERLRRERIGAAMTSKKHRVDSRRKESKTKGGMAILALPFLARGFSAYEVVEITQLSYKQVINARGSLRSAGDLPKLTYEEIKIQRREAHLGKPRNAHGKEYRPEQKERFVLLHDLFESGLITEDLSCWNHIQVIVQNNGDQPKDKVDTVLLEVFLLTRRIYKESGTAELQQTFYKLTREKYPSFFEKYQSTITNLIALTIRNQEQGP